MARAEPAGARHRAGERDAASDRVGQPRLGIARRGGGAGRLRPAGLDVGHQGADEGRRAAARVGRSAGRAAPDHPCGQVLREGRSPARDRHQPAVVHPHPAVPRSPARARPRAAMASAVHADPLRELGRRPERRLVRQPAAVLRRAVPGLVPPRRRWPAGLRVAAAAGGRAAADGSVDRRAGRLHRRAARPAERLHGRSRHHGHLGDVVVDAADRVGLGRRPGPVREGVPAVAAAAGARHHPHLAVLDRAPRRARARLAAVGAHRDLRLGARSRSQEDVEVEGQRRDAGRAARRARLGRGALLGGERRAGRRHRLRSGADEGRTPARHQAAQCLEVHPGRRPATRRPFPGFCRWAAGDGAARSRHAHQPRRRSSPR